MKRSSTRGRGKQQQNRVSQRNEKNMPVCDDPWLAEATHTCHYCAKIIINCKSSNGRDRGTAHINYDKVSYAREAAAKDCRLFEHILNKLNKGARDSNDEDHCVKFSFYADIGNIFDLRSCSADHVSEMGSRDSDDFLKMWSIGVSPRDPAAAFITTPFPNGDVSSIGAFQFAKQCLKDCQTHQECHPLTPAKGGPLRLIAVGSGNGELRLIENFHQIPKYAALSYCWGGDQDYKTTLKNIRSYRQQLHLSPTARTIHDAILVTRKLGLKYLWVDALCIIQDKREDMDAELARMPDIYKAAYVTIIPATSESSATGFLEPRKPSNPMFRLPYRCPTGNLGSIILFDMFSVSSNDYPVETRAWTLQEEILSNRVITFGNDMVWWSCNRGVKSNGGRSHQLIPRDRRLSGDGDSKKVMKEWKNIVTIYTWRKMTNTSDKFNAIASIASEVAQILKKSTTEVSAEYVAGLWSIDLSSQLLWSTTYGSKLQPSPKRYRAPSWSWGSVDDEISFWDSSYRIHGKMRSQIDLENKMLPYGLAKNGFLAIVGQVKKAVWAKGRDHIQDENYPSVGLGHVASTKPDYLEDRSSDDQDIEVWCLAMAKKYSYSEKWGSAGESIAGLILRPIESSSQLTPNNLNWLRTAMSRASILKKDGVYWDKSLNEPILRHTNMPINPDLNSGEISACESYLFHRVGFFELHYNVNILMGSDEYVSRSEEDIAKEREKSRWFNHCPGHLVYII